VLLGVQVLLGGTTMQSVFSLDHKFSVGLRSGLLPGQSSISRQAEQTTSCICGLHGMGHCPAGKSLPGRNRSRANGNIFGWRMLEVYFTALMVPSAT